MTKCLCRVLNGFHFEGVQDSLETFLKQSEGQVATDDHMLGVELEEVFKNVTADKDDEEDSDGVTEADLRKAIKEVRTKKALFKLEHKMKKNLRARSKNKNLEDFEEHLEKKGIAANIDSIRDRIKQRRSIAELEGNQDKLNKEAFKAVESEDEAMEDVDDQRVGRKRRRSISDDEDMENDVNASSKKSQSKS